MLKHCRDAVLGTLLEASNSKFRERFGDVTPARAHLSVWPIFILFTCISLLGRCHPAGTHQTSVRKPKTRNNPLHRDLRREFLSHGVGKEEKRIINAVFNENGNKSLSRSTFG